MRVFGGGGVLGTYSAHASHQRGGSISRALPTPRSLPDANYSLSRNYAIPFPAVAGLSRLKKVPSANNFCAFQPRNLVPHTLTLFAFWLCTGCRRTHFTLSYALFIHLSERRRRRWNSELYTWVLNAHVPEDESWIFWFSARDSNLGLISFFALELKLLIFLLWIKLAAYVSTHKVRSGHS